MLVSQPSVRAFCLALAMLVPLPAGAQEAREVLSLPREHHGKPVTITAELLLPPGTGRVPAMVIHHGSGGATAEREGRYAKELVKLGVATLVIDSFKGRGVASTVEDQSSVTTFEMLDDAFAALKLLAGHSRIDAKRIGIVGFSKGGSVALLAAHERRAARALPDGLRFALHVPFYPSCITQYYKPKTTGAPIHLLLGGADTYVGVTPCKEYAAALKAEGAAVEVTVYPDARHGFDGPRAYNVQQGQNSSRCIFAEQPDGTWKERHSGIAAMDAKGVPIPQAYKAAMDACRTLGVSGGPNPAAKAAAMVDLQADIRRFLVETR